MAYTSTNKDANDRYEFRQDQPTVSRLVKPSDDSHAGERQNTSNSYTTMRRQDDDRYTNGARGPRDSAYESIRRSDDQHSVQRSTGVDHRQETDRRGGEYVRHVPTAHITVDPGRRPGDGNARTCVMEINIAVSTGGGRNPQASFISSNVSSKPPAIRSTATIDDVRYIDLNFQSPQNTAQLATDGIIRRSPS